MQMCLYYVDAYQRCGSGVIHRLHQHFYSFVRKMDSVIRIHLEGVVQVLVSESVMNVVQEIRCRFQRESNPHFSRESPVPIWSIHKTSNSRIHIKGHLTSILLNEKVISPPIRRINSCLSGNHGVDRLTYISQLEFFTIIHIGNCGLALGYVCVVINIVAQIADIC